MSSENRQRVLDYLGSNLEEFGQQYSALTDVGDTEFDETVADLFDPSTIAGAHVFELAGMKAEDWPEEEEEEEGDSDDDDADDEEQEDPVPV